MRIIPLMYVKEEHTLGRTLYDTDHRLLLRAGTPISKAHKTRLQEGGYFSVYVEDDYTNYKPSPIIPDQLRDNCLAIIKDAFKDFKAYMELERAEQTPGNKSRLQK